MIVNHYYNTNSNESALPESRKAALNELTALVASLLPKDSKDAGYIDKTVQLVLDACAEIKQTSKSKCATSIYKCESIITSQLGMT